MDMVTLAYRTQGLIVAAGNPKGVRSASDLAQTGLRFINRNPGSGTRLWLDANSNGWASLPKISMAMSGLSTRIPNAPVPSPAVRPMPRLGLQASALQHNLDFIPLFEERYDLVLPREQEKVLAPLLDYIQTTAFRGTISTLSGYTTTHSGEQISI